MRARTRPSCRLGGLAPLLLLAASAAAFAGDAGRAAAQRAVQALVGDAACRHDGDCRTIALPEQACGGPQGWLAYSTLRTDPVALQQAVQRLAAYPSGAASTCGVVPDPGAACLPLPAASAPQARQCRLRPRAAGGPLG